MSDIHPLTDSPAEISFIKPSWKENRYELADEEGRCFGRLSHSGWTGASSIEGASGGWELSRPKGFFHSHIDITAADGTALGRYDLSQWKGGGTFDLDGVSYVIGHQGFSGTRFSVERDGVPLFDIKVRWGFGAEKATASVSDAGRGDDHGTLLLLLALEQMVAHCQNGASGAAITAATIN